MFLMGLRFSLAAAVLVSFVPIPRGYLLKVFWIAMIGFCLQYGLTFTGLSMIDASLAVIVILLDVPFAVLIAAFIFRERPGWQRLTGMLIAFAGVALIAGQPTLRGQLFAVFLIGSGAMIWAIGQIMVKQLKNRYNDPTMHRKFVVGIDRAKMRLFNVEQRAQEDVLDVEPAMSYNNTASKFKTNNFADFSF